MKVSKRSWFCFCLLLFFFYMYLIDYVFFAVLGNACVAAALGSKLDCLEERTGGSK